MIRLIKKYLLGSIKSSGLQLVLMIVRAILEGLVFLAVIPFLGALLADDKQNAGLWLTVIAALGLTALTINIGTNIQVFRAAAIDVQDTLYQQVGQKLIRLPLGWFNTKRPGQVTSLLGPELEKLSNLASLILPMAINAIVPPTVITIALFFFDWRLATILLTAGILLSITQTLMRAKVDGEVRATNRWQEQTGRFLLAFTRLQPVLRSSGQAENGWPLLEKTLRDETKLLLHAMRKKGLYAQLGAAIVQLAFALFVLTGLAFVFNLEMQPILYLSLAFAVARFVSPLEVIAVVLNEVHTATRSLENMAELLETPEQQIQATPKTDPPQETTGKYDIVFENVTFGYTPNKPVLQNINLKVPEGSMTALIGPSGSGKSTVHRLTARFWDADEGRILIGGRDVRSFKQEELMHIISMVFQDVYLFDTTIKENLLIARPEATSEEITHAIKMARLDKVIAGLPEGINTRVGEGGSLLSGGEKQRVAIARAFLKDAPILLLDEITSALDGENEREVTKALHELAAKRTVILIAHRMTTIKEADQICVIASDATGTLGDTPSTVLEAGRYETIATTGGLLTKYLSAQRVGS